MVDFLLDDWRQKHIPCPLLDHLEQQLHSPSLLPELLTDQSLICVIGSAVAVDPNLCLPLFVKSYQFLVGHNWPEFYLQQMEGAKSRAKDSQRLLPIEVSQRTETQRYVLDQKLCRIIERAQV